MNFVDVIRYRISWLFVIGLLLVGLFFVVNSNSDTCVLVGCPGWCQIGGTNCGTHTGEWNVNR